jgi:hypothetical protein
VGQLITATSEQKPPVPVSGCVAPNTEGHKTETESIFSDAQLDQRHELFVLWLLLVVLFKNTERVNRASVLALTETE